jgi:hypothetical protein
LFLYFLRSIMTRSAIPDHWQELMAGYVLGDLSPEEAEELQHLLAEHPELAVEVALLQESLALMPFGLPQQTPSPQLREAILATAQRTTVQPSQLEQTVDSPDDRFLPSNLSSHTAHFSSPSRRFRSGRPWVSWIGGAIAAAAIVALSLDNYQLRQENRQVQTVITALQQRGTFTYALEGTDQAHSASGSLVVADGREVIILAKNLPVLPAGQVYRLWAMPRSGNNPTYCGQFSSSQAGRVSTHWLAPAATCESTTVQMLITAEKASDPPIPKGSLVMKSRI